MQRRMLRTEAVEMKNETPICYRQEGHCCIQYLNLVLLKITEPTTEQKTQTLRPTTDNVVSQRLFLKGGYKNEMSLFEEVFLCPTQLTRPLLTVEVFSGVTNIGFRV